MAFRAGFTMAPIGVGYHQPQMIINPLIGRGFGSAPAQAPPKKPVTTVFVGNISEKCSNEFMEHLLKECGEIVSWKRTQGTKGKINTFGFCDFEAPEGTLRALRILNDFQIGERKLLVRADDKVRAELRAWSIEQRKRQGKPDLHLKENELPADEDDLRKDEEVRLKLLNWIETDHPDLLLAEDPGSPKAEKKVRKETDGRKDKRHRSRSRSRSRSRNGRRGRSRSRSQKRRSRRRHSSSSSFSSDRSSGSSSSRSRSRSRSPKRKRDSRRGSTDSDIEEKKILKRQLKEKEQAYEARLKKWEKREREMARRYEKEDRQQRGEARFVQKEAKKLRVFLEEYDDIVHDAKYYKSSSLFQRRRDFEREREADLKDRLKEQSEINEIKQQLLKDNVEEAVADKLARRRHQEQEEAAMRRIRSDSGSPNPHTLLGQQEGGGGSSSDSESDESNPDDPGESNASASVTVNTNDIARESGTPIPSVPTTSDKWRSVDSDTPASPTPSAVATGPTLNFNSPTPAQKSLSQRILGVFGFDEEEQDNSKRIRFQVSHEERLQSLTEEEKKRMIKDIIDKIPTGREDLFAATVEWDYLSKPVIEQRVRPWVAKKVSEFIGEEDKSLCDFICESVERKVDPKKLLEDVAMIFDEDAEQFVMKMWRLIIYESESKKLGLSKVKG